MFLNTPHTQQARIQKLTEIIREEAMTNADQVTPTPKPQTPNPKPQTPNPKP